MSTSVATRQTTPVEAFKMEILTPDRAEDLFSALPAHVKPERFERNLVTALMQEPRLMSCDPSMVFREVAKAAALGLVLDPQLGEAYLIVGWNSRERRSEPQIRIGYRGIMKLARQSGDVAQIYAHEVRQNDECEIILGDEKRILHKPNFKGDRGIVILYYAVVKFKDGTSDFEPMSLTDIHRIRDRSDAYRAFKEGKIKSTPWATDEEEMSKKTVIRRLLKRVSQSPDLADAFRIEDEADPTDFNVMPQRPSLRDRIGGQSGAAPGFNADLVDNATKQIEGAGSVPMEIVKTDDRQKVEASNSTAANAAAAVSNLNEVDSLARIKDLGDELDAELSKAKDPTSIDVRIDEFKAAHPDLTKQEMAALKPVKARHLARVAKEAEAMQANVPGPDDDGALPDDDGEE